MVCQLLVRGEGEGVPVSFRRHPFDPATGEKFFRANDVDIKWQIFHSFYITKQPTRIQEKCPAGNEEIVHRQIFGILQAVFPHIPNLVFDAIQALSFLNMPLVRLYPFGWQRHIPFIIGGQLRHHLPKLQACVVVARYRQGESKIYLVLADARSNQLDDQ